MQMSAINANVGFGKLTTNTERIKELENKRAAIQWGSEGCTGDLNAEDSYELEIRKELADLRGKHIAMSWASEGCNCSLCQKDMDRMRALENILDGIEQKQAQDNKVKNTYDMPTANIYGVPDHTFYGEWAN